MTDQPGPISNAIAVLDRSDGLASTEKVRLLAAALIADASQTEQGAQFVSILEVARSLGMDPAAYLPDDADELDALLARGAQLFLAARSDDAQPLAVVDASPASP